MSVSTWNKKTIVRLVVFFVIVAAALGTAVYKLYGRTEKGITATGTIEVTKTDVTRKWAATWWNAIFRKGIRSRRARFWPGSTGRIWMPS